MQLSQSQETFELKVFHVPNPSVEKEENPYVVSDTSGGMHVFKDSPTQGDAANLMFELIEASNGKYFTNQQVGELYGWGISQDDLQALRFKTPDGFTSRANDECLDKYRDAIIAQVKCEDGDVRSPASVTQCLRECVMATGLIDVAMFAFKKYGQLVKEYPEKSLHDLVLKFSIRTNEAGEPDFNGLMAYTPTMLLNQQGRLYPLDIASTGISKVPDEQGVFDVECHFNNSTNAHIDIADRLRATELAPNEKVDMSLDIHEALRSGTAKVDMYIGEEYDVRYRIVSSNLFFRRDPETKFNVQITHNDEIPMS